ncbi:MarR family winged helix-turn-helix transcriptional regulator [Cohnella cholangitidis]|uniref:MarR family winged helix-turn-helix transcriptional regulator n=1 Tax=Cohnella cholangitidis TaxID=2598458 RepID=UPI001E38E1F5|nr:MarR family transcriptional regulator [Cohnella cholangitidis]
MNPKRNFNELDVNDFARAIEDLTRIFIRLPSIEKLSFTTLSVLHTLSRKSPMRLTELIATEQVTQSAITQLVTRLERDGYVKRQPDPSDGRAVLVHITPQGAEIIDSRRFDRITQIAKLFEGSPPRKKNPLLTHCLH